MFKDFLAEEEETAKKTNGKHNLDYSTLNTIMYYTLDNYSRLTLLKTVLIFSIPISTKTKKGISVDFT